jgi:hypothetical protein
MKKRKKIAWTFIIIGLVVMLFRTFGNLTGFAISDSFFPTLGGIWFFIVGFGMIMIGCGMMAGIVSTYRERIDYLQEILEGKIPLTKLPHYASAKEGIEKSKELEPFTAPTKDGKYTLFIHVATKDESRQVADSLVRGRPIYSIPELESELGKKNSSLERADLEKIARSFLISGNRKFGRIIKTDRFGWGEKDSPYGRYWEREAHLDPSHDELGVPLPHYNVEYKSKGTNLHVLITS